MLKVQDLIDSGYKKFDNQMNAEYKPNYLGSYQKCVSDELGKKYFITIDYWDMSSLTKVKKETFSAKTQFNAEGFHDAAFGVDLHINDSMTIESIEEWYEMTWKATKAGYYEKNY